MNLSQEFDLTIHLWTDPNLQILQVLLVQLKYMRFLGRFLQRYLDDYVAQGGILPFSRFINDLCQSLDHAIHGDMMGLGWKIEVFKKRRGLYDIESGKSRGFIVMSHELFHCNL